MIATSLWNDFVVLVLIKLGKLDETLVELVLSLAMLG